VKPPNGFEYPPYLPGLWGETLSWRMKRRYYFMKSPIITAINRGYFIQTQASSSGDTNTVGHHTQGAPTRYAITEAKTFTVSAVQRYDSYPAHKYRDSGRKKIYG